MRIITLPSINESVEGEDITNEFFDDIWPLCCDDRIIGDTSIVWVFENYKVSVYIDEVLTYELGVNCMDKWELQQLRDGRNLFTQSRFDIMAYIYDDDYMEMFDAFWDKWGGQYHDCINS